MHLVRQWWILLLHPFYSKLTVAFMVTIYGRQKKKKSLEFYSLPY